MKPRTSLLSSRDHLPVVRQPGTTRPNGVIRVSYSLLDTIEKAYAVIVVIVFSGGFMHMLFGAEEGVSGVYYVLMVILYGMAGFFLVLALSYRRLLLRIPLFVVLLVGLAILSSLWSGEPADTLRRSISAFGTCLVAVYFGVRFQPRELFHVLWLACAIMMIASLIFIMFYPQYAIDDNPYILAESRGWRGIFTHKNTMGSMALIALITYLFTHFDRATVGRFCRLANPAMLFLAVVLLVLSKSSTSQLTVVISVAVVGYVALTRYVGLVRGPLMLLAIWLVVVTGFVVSSNLDVVANLVGKDATLSGRTEIWSVAIQLIGEKPLLGYGYGNNIIERLFDLVQAHNGYINLALGLGMVGLGLLLILLLQTGRKVHAHAVASSSALALWPLSVYVAFITRNLTEASFMAATSLWWCLFVYISTVLSSSRAYLR